LVIQCFSALPAVVDLTYYQRDMVVAYLHLVLLGFASAAGMYIVFMEQSHLRNVMVYWWVFLGALVVMEAVLVVKSYFFAFPRLYSDYLLWLTALGLFAAVTILTLKYLLKPTSY
jgi:hypothetical protein